MLLTNIDHPSLPCPHCEEKGGLSYEELPNSRLVYTIEEGELEGEHTVHNGASREYKCSNCSGEFLLFDPDPTMEPQPE